MQRGSSCNAWRLEQNSAVPVALPDVRAAGAIPCSGRGRRGKLVFLLLEMPRLQARGGRERDAGESGSESALTSGLSYGQTTMASRPGARLKEGWWFVGRDGDVEKGLAVRIRAVRWNQLMTVPRVGGRSRTGRTAEGNMQEPQSRLPSGEPGDMLDVLMRL